MCIGKWHVGDQPEFLPTRQGFDHYFGIPYSNDMQRSREGDRREGRAAACATTRWPNCSPTSSRAASSSVTRTRRSASSARARTGRSSSTCRTPPCTRRSIPARRSRGKSANGRFGDWVEEVDWSVGRVLDTLRELKLDEKTLVVFTSDNGPWLIKGADGGSAGPLRGGKGSTWEGGVRVPTLAWWPGKIAARQRVRRRRGHHRSAARPPSRIAGGTVPAEPVIDGRDISPLLFGRSTQSPREAHYYFAGYNLQAVRQGPWKLAIAPQPETMGKDAGSDATKTPRLYNLDQEIGEQTEPRRASIPTIVAKLQALADKMNAEIGGNNPTARRPAGEVANPQTLYPVRSGKPRAKTGQPSAAEPRPARQTGRPQPAQTWRRRSRRRRTANRRQAIHDLLHRGDHAARRDPRCARRHWPSATHCICAAGVLVFTIRDKGGDTSRRDRTSCRPAIRSASSRRSPKTARSHSKSATNPPSPPRPAALCPASRRGFLRRPRQSRTRDHLYRQGRFPRSHHRP